MSQVRKQLKKSEKATSFYEKKKKKRNTPTTESTAALLHPHASSSCPRGKFISGWTPAAAGKRKRKSWRCEAVLVDIVFFYYYQQLVPSFSLSSISVYSVTAPLDRTLNCVFGPSIFSFKFFFGLLVLTVGRTFGSFDLCCVWQNICRDKSDGNSFHYCLSCYHRPFQYFRSDVTCDTGGVINNSNNYGNNVLFEGKKM